MKRSSDVVNSLNLEATIRSKTTEEGDQAGIRQRALRTKTDAARPRLEVAGSECGEEDHCGTAELESFLEPGCRSTCLGRRWAVSLRAELSDQATRNTYKNKLDSLLSFSKISINSTSDRNIQRQLLKYLHQLFRRSLGVNCRETPGDFSVLPSRVWTEGGGRDMREPKSVGY